MSLRVHILFLVLLTLLVSCKKDPEVAALFDCDRSNFQANELVQDATASFSIKLPKHWKTNLYVDNAVSSIFAGDTTKQLTETVLVDFTKLKHKQLLDSSFTATVTRALQEEGFRISKTGHSLFKTKNSFYAYATGVKKNYPYAIFTQYIQLDQQLIFHCNIEVYGEEQRVERLCKALALTTALKV